MRERGDPPVFGYFQIWATRHAGSAVTMDDPVRPGLRVTIIFLVLRFYICNVFCSVKFPFRVLVGLGGFLAVVLKLVFFFLILFLGVLVGLGDGEEMMNITTAAVVGAKKI